MTYVKAQLRGYPALTVIQSTSNKMTEFDEPQTALQSEPAYEADE